ncbi:MAG: hypothetical protein M1812_000029 [Candelaria pacifica]|nr:MAG: hypothetical protein M1812_000029 [Candelaria pacifica]
MVFPKVTARRGGKATSQAKPKPKPKPKPKATTTASSTKSKKRTSESAADDYDSDDGFVVDEDGEGGRKVKKIKSQHFETEEGGVGIDGEVIPGDGEVDEDGSEFWEGILMPLEQFNALIDLLPHIETVLKGKGVELPRPDYEGLPSGGDAEDGEEQAVDDFKDQDVKDENGASKKNFEATSEEDEGGEDAE